MREGLVLTHTSEGTLYSLHTSFNVFLLVLPRLVWFSVWTLIGKVFTHTIVPKWTKKTSYDKCKCLNKSPYRNLEVDETMDKKELCSKIFTFSCSYIWKAAHEAHFIIFNQLLIIIIIINHIKISQHYPISLQCFWLNNDQPVRMWPRIIRLWINMMTIPMSVPSITTYNKSCR